MLTILDMSNQQLIEMFSIKEGASNANGSAGYELRNAKERSFGLKSVQIVALDSDKYNQNSQSLITSIKQMKQKRMHRNQVLVYLIKSNSQMNKLVSTSHHVANQQQLASKFNQIFISHPKIQPHSQLSSAHHCCHHQYDTFNDWTMQQTKLLFQLFKVWGPKWTKISHQMTGKSQNCVKNRFYGSLRKSLRKLNRASRNLPKKFKKQLKYQSITRIIDASQGLFRLYSPLKQQSQYLSKKILNLAQQTQQNQQQIPPLRAQQLILEINKFNMSTRSYKSKKKIKNTHRNSKKQPTQQNLNESTQNHQPQIKNSQEIIKIQSHSNCAEQCNQDVTIALLNKSATTVDFPLVQQNRLKDYQLQEDDPHKKIKLQQGNEQLFDQAHSPLQCQLWI